MFRNQSKGTSERVIVNEEVVNLATLRAEANKAGTRFWVLLILISLLSSMVVPYLSMASVAASNSKVFDGDVIPGYSMGGIDIASYGVDLNSWAKSGKQKASSPTMVKSQYGYWTAERAENAADNLVKSQKADKDIENSDLQNFQVDDEMMTDDEKARGWIGITRDKGEGRGLSGFSTNPNGTEVEKRNDYSESVAPYRTQTDVSFWDTQTIGGSEPTVVTTLYPDFVIVGWDKSADGGKGAARVLTNPDSIQNSTNSTDATSGALAETSAVPHYVPLSTLFKAYDLADTVMGDNGMITLDTLLDAISADANKNGGGKYSPILNNIVENKKNSQSNDLLLGTHYDNLNGENKSSEPGSDAWNPYPYSMVFKTSFNEGTVVSSIYNNTEAYVYFSPQSVYTNYLALRSEYDTLVNENATAIANADPAATFQMGYYLAGMSILEAYLNEALPQDMTRGYVGPVEGNPLASANKALSNANKLDTRSDKEGTVSNLFKQSLSGVDQMASAEAGSEAGGAVGFKSVPYSQVMYDFADAAIIKYGQAGENTRLGATSAIMNTLSTYGYGSKEKGQNVNGDQSAGQGPNRGMTRRQTMARVTSFGPYGKGAATLNSAITEDKGDPMLHPSVSNTANTGMYVPVYYPIQQHVMPIDPELAYRFQVLSLIPYNTLAYELGKNGFNNTVSLSYGNNAIENLTRTKNYYNKNASLSKQLDDIDEEGGSLGQYDKSRSIVLNPQSNATSMVGDKATKKYAQDKDLTERVDNALRAFSTGRLNSDNVHDLVDVVRAIPGVKYETFVRYYNPIKSSGGATDFFLTRITPAQTAYMPSVLTKGYESAGGMTNSTNTPSTTDANFDYFSIPSFAPCFAAHTAENTYYGALTYELRAFYTQDFLNSLPADSNVPALEEWEEIVEEQEEVSSDTAIEGLKEKIVTIYVLAKRLAYANAYSALLAAEDGKEGSVTLGSLYHASNQLADILPGSEAVKKALTPNNLNQYPGPENDDGSAGTSPAVQEGELKKDEDTSSTGTGTTGSAGGAAGGGTTGTTGATGTTGTGTGDPDSETEPTSTGKTRQSSSGTIYVKKKRYLESKSFSSDYSKHNQADNDRAFARSYANYTKYIQQLQRQEDISKEKEETQAEVRARKSGKTFAYDYQDVYVTYSDWKERKYIATNVVHASVSGIAKVSASLFPVASGDYISSTPASDTGQVTTYYDNGDGTTTAVAYANVDGQWVAQAESTRTSASQTQGDNLTTGDVNGIPAFMTAESTNADGTTQDVPSTAPDGTAASSGTTAGTTPADSTMTDEAKDKKEEQKSQDAQGGASQQGTGSDQSGQSGTDASGNQSGDKPQYDTSDRNYADGGGAADQIYKTDNLGLRSYYKATDAQWAELDGKHVVGDQVTFYMPKGLNLAEGQDTTGFDYVMQEFGQKHLISDAVLNNRTVWCKESINGFAFVTSVKTIFSALYKDAFNRYLTPHNAYYWDTPDAIAGLGAKPECSDYKDDEVAKYNTVAMERAKASDAATAKQELDGYCDEAFADAAACLASLAMLNDEMPAQMQNVLAWADCQGSSESEMNYLVDPSEANATLIAIGGEKSDGNQVGEIHSLDDLQEAGFKIIRNNGEWAAVADSSATSEDEAQPQDLQSRMVRGVAGTTYTASLSLAGYTITATVGRIDRLVTTQASAASIPYSGIYSGNLNSGAERYALIQAHSIDRQSISSRLAGDLRSRGTTGNMVSLLNSNSTPETQEYIKKQSNLTAELMASGIPASTDMLINTIGSVTGSGSDSSGKTVATTESKASPISLSGLFGTQSTGTQTMALASTFDDTTMNRRSAVTQTFNSSSRKMVANSVASSTASAADEVTANRQWAKSLVSGKFSDAYAVIQSIALMMVLAFLMVIAFQNFVGYTSGNEKDYINAQTKLKTVLPRALIAVAMIGLPPMGGQQGFPGGCYILLQIVNAIMDSVLSVFTQGNSIRDTLAKIGEAFVWSFDIWDLATTLLNVIAVIIFMICSAIIMFLVFITDIVLFFFWALGPIVWAFYVWPYTASDGLQNSHGLKKILGSFTGKMGWASFTNGEVGRDAPMGWLMGYIMTLATTVKWVLLYWGVGIAFNILHGGAGTSVMTVINSAVSNAAGQPEIKEVDVGEALINGAADVFDGTFGNLLLALLFALVTYMTFRTFKNSMGGALGALYGVTGNLISAGLKTAGGGVLSGLGGTAGSVAKLATKMKGSDSKLAQAAGAVLDSKPVQLGADKISKAADTVETIANSQGASDMVRRVNAFTDNLAKDVPDRADSSGAFDDLIAVGTEEYVDENGETKTRQVMQVAPSLQLAGQLGGAALSATYQSVKTTAAMTDLAIRATALASDPEYARLAQHQAIVGMAGELAASGDANGIGGVAGRIADFATHGGKLSEADIKAFGSHMRKQMEGSDNIVDALDGYAQNQAICDATRKDASLARDKIAQARKEAKEKLAARRGVSVKDIADKDVRVDIKKVLSQEERDTLSRYNKASKAVTRSEQFARILGTDAATLSQQVGQIADAQDKQGLLNARILSMQNTLTKESKNNGAGFRDLAERKEEIETRHQNKLEGVAAIAHGLKESGSISAETAAEVDKMIANAQAGRSTALTAATMTALRGVGKHTGRSFDNFTTIVNEAGHTTDRHGRVVNTLGTSKYDDKVGEVKEQIGAESRRIATASADMDGVDAIIESEYLGYGKTKEKFENSKNAKDKARLQTARQRIQGENAQRVQGQLRGHRLYDDTFKDDETREAEAEQLRKSEKQDRETLLRGYSAAHQQNDKDSADVYQRITDQALVELQATEDAKKQSLNEMQNALPSGRNLSIADRVDIEAQAILKENAIMDEHEKANEVARANHNHNARTIDSQYQIADAQRESDTSRAEELSDIAYDAVANNGLKNGAMRSAFWDVLGSKRDNDDKGNSKK